MFRLPYFPVAGSGPVVAIMCEYDALPGIGHACGHNLIAESSIGAAIAVKAVMSAQKTQDMPKVRMKTVRRSSRVEENELSSLIFFLLRVTETALPMHWFGTDHVRNLGPSTF